MLSQRSHTGTQAAQPSQSAQETEREREREMEAERDKRMKGRPVIKEERERWRQGKKKNSKTL